MRPNLYSNFLNNKFNFIGLILFISALLTLSSCFKETKIKVKTDYPLAIEGEITNSWQEVVVSRIPEDDLNSGNWDVADAIVYIENQNGVRYKLDVFKMSEFHLHKGKFSLSLDDKWVLKVVVDNEEYVHQCNFPKPSEKHKYWVETSDTSLVFNIKFFDLDENNIYVLNQGRFGVEHIGNLKNIIGKTFSVNGRMRFFQKGTYHKITIPIYPKKEFDMANDIVNWFEKNREFSNNLLFYNLPQHQNTTIYKDALINIYHRTNIEDSLFLEDNSSKYITFNIKDSLGNVVNFNPPRYGMLRFKGKPFENTYAKEHIDTLNSGTFDYSHWKTLGIFKGFNNDGGYSIGNILGLKIDYTLNIYDGVSFWEGEGAFIITRPPMALDLIVRKL